MSASLIDGLFVVTLIGLIVLIVMLIITVYRANHVLSNWSRVTDTVSDSMVRLIPAIINVGTIGKAIHQVLETIAEHKKNEKK
jgi:ABC-type arginine transport system permease subunit